MKGKGKKKSSSRKNDDGKIKICVQTPSGETIHPRFDPSSIISDIKRHVKHTWGYRMSRQHLSFDGQELQNNMTIMSYNIQDDDVINLELGTIQISAAQKIVADFTWHVVPQKRWKRRRSSAITIQK